MAHARGGPDGTEEALRAETIGTRAGGVAGARPGLTRMPAMPYHRMRRPVVRSPWRGVHASMRSFRTLCVTAAVSALVVLSACSGSKNEEKPQAADAADAAVSAPSIAVGPEVGSRAPAFSLPNGRGEAVALADYAGKPVAVVFYRGQW